MKLPPTTDGKRQTASAEFAMKIDAMLNESRYEKISDDIQSNNSNYRLPKYPNKADADVDEYIGIFEDIGYFAANHLFGANIARERFTYDIEKAWCNVTVQETIRDERASDKSKTAQSDPQYGNFEKLAKEYLATDGLSCNDLDSPTAPAAKKKKAGVRH
jgi:lysyl-tRNA synthetase class II